MKTKPPLLACLLALGTFAGAGVAWQPTFQEPASTVGEPATALTVGAWHNNIGQEPSLASLNGKVWLVEMWATW